MAAVEADPYGIEVHDDVVSYEGPFQSFPEDVERWLQLFTGGTVVWGESEAAYAAELLKRPRRDVVSQLVEHRRLLTNPATRTRRLVAVMELDPLPGIAEQLRQRGIPVSKADGLRRPYSLSEMGVIPCP
jgi:hypothetical protein